MPSRVPERRLRDILAAIARIQAYVADIGGVKALMQDQFVHRDAVERQLLIVSEAASKLRGQIERLEPSIDWDAIRGIGNFIRHDYDGIDNQIIEKVLSDELDPLKLATERLINYFTGLSRD